MHSSLPFLFLLMSSPALSADIPLFSDDFGSVPSSGPNGWNGWQNTYTSDTWERVTGRAGYGIGARTDNSIGTSSWSTNNPSANFMRQTGQNNSWRYPVVDVAFNSSDDDSVGVVFNYRNTDNFYLAFFTQHSKPNPAGASASESVGYGKIYRVLNGVGSELGTVNVSYTRSQWQRMRVDHTGTEISLYLDQNRDGTYQSGDKVLTVQDDSHSAGVVGVWAYDNSSAAFDDVSVVYRNTDTDTVPDYTDNCPAVANTDQADLDGDKLGDACDSDRDGDGFDSTDAGGKDCDDAEATIHPDATEVCNGIDDNCDEQVDNDAQGDATWYADTDGDGFGDASATLDACNAPTGYVSNGKDCDDGEPSVFPGAKEYCASGDQNCDGDPDAGATDATLWYLDDDSDGYGTPTDDTTACSKPTGYSENDEDCDDGFASDNPAADEVCDGRDNNCDDSVDEPSAVDASTWFADADSDTYGDANNTEVSCTQPTGHVSRDGDCNDANRNISPAAQEQCNQVDDDCDGAVDDGVSFQDFRPDTDGDGFGDPNAPTLRACSPPSGHTLDGTDCDDTDGEVSPDADERCNSIDDDCDGTVDEPDAVDTTDFYLDADGDSFGDAATSSPACSKPPGYAFNDLDCDDENPSVAPGAAEQCNEGDDDCDGEIDEDIVNLNWYPDNDGDSYGDGAGDVVVDCKDPGFRAAVPGDCDDDNAEVNPARIEVCNGIDDDCDGLVDGPSAADAVLFFEDTDGDGFGNSDARIGGCEAPDGYTDVEGDCDDDNADRAPDIEESCDGIDNDCDTFVDEGVVGAQEWFADSDGDGFGDPEVTAAACEAPDGFVADGTDCDDSSAEVNPGAVEQADNGIDEDCSGSDEQGWPTSSDRPFEPRDTGVPVDSDVTAGPAGCGCNQSTPRAPWALLLLLPLLRRRR